MEKLQEQGLLSAEGRRLLAEDGGNVPARAGRPRFPGGAKMGAARTAGGREGGGFGRDGGERPRGRDFDAPRGDRGADRPRDPLAGRPVRGGLGAPVGAPISARGADVVAEPRQFGARDEGARPARPRTEAARMDAPRGGTKAERKAAHTRAARAAKGAQAEEIAGERLHKVMAQAGVASRRHSEELIQAGRVTVNGKVVTELGMKVLPGRDRVEVDGAPLGQKEDAIYVLMYKPKGYVTTLYDPQGRPKVTDLLEEQIEQRIYPVGRLDYDTEGLLLLTNDGELANAMMHPAREVKKTYIAKVRGVPNPTKLRMLETGVELEDGITAPAEVKMIDAKGPNAATVSIRIHEGRNRQVRRMFEAIGHEVIHLKRTTMGPLNLKDLPLGKWRYLSEREIDDLKRAVGLKAAPHRGARVAAMVEKRKTGRRGAARFENPREFTEERGPRPAGRLRGPSPFAEGEAPRPAPAGRGFRERGPAPYAEGEGPRPAARGGFKPRGGPGFGGEGEGPRPAARGGFKPRGGTGFGGGFGGERGERGDREGARPAARGFRPQGGGGFGGGFGGGARGEGRGPRPENRGPRDGGGKRR